MLTCEARERRQGQALRTMRRIFRGPLSQQIRVPASRWLVEVGVGLGFGLIAGFSRLALTGALQAAAPFAFVFVAITAATVLGGWKAGVAASLTGQTFTWYAILQPQYSWSIVDRQTVIGVATATLAQLVMVAVIALYQREVRRASRARDRADRDREVLMRELDHRVKNTLAVVQSIARSSFGDESRDRVRAFAGRLVALAGAHDILLRDGWQEADFAEVVGRSLRPFRKWDHDQFKVEGDRFLLPPRAAINLSLAVHELATNALKYGALSCPDGLVEICWTTEPGGGFEFTWRETGGPPVSPPTHRGFGTNLIARGIAAEIGAKVELDFAPTGLVCHFHGKVTG